MFLTSISHTLHTQPIWHGSVCSVQCVEQGTFQRHFMGSTLTTDCIFLSSANNVSTGPTCQIGCVFVCLCSVFPVFFCNKFSRLLIDLMRWFLAVVLAYCLFRTLNPAIQEVGWAMPHSDFLAWLSSATLKNFYLRCFNSDFDAVKSIFGLLL